MQGTFLFYTIISILIIQFVLEFILDYINAKQYDTPIPEELSDVFNKAEYLKSQNYKKDNYRFGVLHNSFSVALSIGFLAFGGFQWIDSFTRNITEHSIGMALIFFGIIILGSTILDLPFSYYKTFVIEDKFKFNTTTKQLFLLDKIKEWGMTLIFGGGLLALIMWFFQWTGTYFWLYAWAIITVFSLFMNLFYSKLVVPLFNKQTSLKDGTLKDKINAYAHTVGFDLTNIFVIDGSKRSTKANAYFSGFGKEKRITLYDTLINDLEEDEIIAVLAHEVGHYKRKHIIFNLIASIVLTGVTLYILSVFINNPELSLAIGVTQASFHAALIGFGILYSPISELTGLLMNFLSRKFEYQADDYAKETFAAAPLIRSLKKLSNNNLSNLTPHPAYVFMHYSHPPLIARIRNLKL